MPTTTYAALRYPQTSDSPNGPQQIQNLATDADTKVIVPVASPAARTALTGMPAGMVVYEQSTARFYRFDGTNWDYYGGTAPPIAAVAAGAGWNANGAGSQPGCYLDSSGLVHLVGGVNPASAYNPQDGGTHTAFVLPVGYRPATTLSGFILPVPVAASIFVTLDLHNDGSVNVTGGTTTSIAAGLSHWLNSISFHPGYAGNAPLS